MQKRFVLTYCYALYRYVLALALRDMNQTENITEAPKDCDNSGSIWESGKVLFEYVSYNYFILYLNAKLIVCCIYNDLKYY